MGLWEEDRGTTPTRRYGPKTQGALTKYSVCLGKDAPMLVSVLLEQMGLYRDKEEVT